MVFTTGCSDDTVDPTPIDSTPVVDEIFNRFTIGFDQYDLVIDPNSTVAYQRKVDGLTIINVVGSSKKVSGTPIVEGKGEIEIKIDAQGVGTWKQVDMDDLEIEVATGEGNRRKEYSFDDNSNMICNIIKYDSVGGYIQGTFSGILKDGVNSITVKKGEFKVERIADQ
jgi:hypothetical protein